VSEKLNASVVFGPREVFRTLYKEACVQACREGFLAHQGSQLMILPSSFIKMLEGELVRQFNHFTSESGASSVAWHLGTLSGLKSFWNCTYSEDTCFSCMMTRPQYRLRCGHFTCGKCVETFGTETDGRFEVRRCALCDQETMGFAIPVAQPTASERLLSIDGGGARGVIPLVFLRELEKAVGLEHPVQENFDFIVGTSSGMPFHHSYTSPC
jgi:hypothetical protein